jgi:hypothetical protein
METNNTQVQKVASILRIWHGSDAAEEARPEEVAQEIDEAYAEYLASLPALSLALRRGREEWERKVG